MNFKNLHFCSFFDEKVRKIFCIAVHHSRVSISKKNQKFSIKFFFCKSTMFQQTAFKCYFNHTFTIARNEDPPIHFFWILSKVKKSSKVMKIIVMHIFGLMYLFAVQYSIRKWRKKSKKFEIFSCKKIHLFSFQMPFQSRFSDI